MIKFTAFRFLKGLEEKGGENMEKRTIISEMKKDTKGAAFISMTTLSRHLGRGKAYAKEMVAGLDMVDNKYFIPDVAGRIMDRRERGGH